MSTPKFKCVARGRKLPRDKLKDRKEPPEMCTIWLRSQSPCDLSCSSKLLKYLSFSPSLFIPLLTKSYLHSMATNSSVDKRSITSLPSIESHLNELLNARELAQVNLYQPISNPESLEKVTIYLLPSSQSS